MRLHRFLVEKNLALDTLLIEDESLLHQWLHVFRFEEGQEVKLCDGKGGEVLVILDSITKKRVTVRVLERFPAQPEPVRHITMCLALTKRDSFEYAVQKAVEVGVTQIQPLVSERSIKHDLNMERTVAIMKEAVEQSGQTWMPTLLPVQTLEEVMASKTKEVVDVFCEGSTEQAFESTDKAMRVFIGPEGGWSESEVAFAKKSKAKLVRLGSTVLRAETAATIAAFLAAQG